MMDHNQIFLLELIKHALFQTPFEIPADVDWDAVFEESFNQMVVSLVAEFVPAEYAARFKEIQMKCRAQYMKILYEQNVLVDLFFKNQIPVTIMKGVAAAQYYPVPINRVMGDIDVLVPPEEYDRAKDLLQNHHYLLDHENEERHATYYKNGTCIELHFRFSHDTPELENYIVRSFSDIQLLSINGFRFPILPEAVNGLVILAHIRHHIITSGLGLRQLIDWEMYVHAHSRADFWVDTLLPMAQACGLLDSVAIVTRLCQKYLGLPDDLSWCDDVEDARLDFIMDYILESGNFGVKTTTEEPRPVENISLKMNKAIKNKTFFKILQEAGQNNWKACHKYPFLKPFAFIYQAFRYLFKGIKAALHGGVAEDFSNANKKAKLNKMFELHQKP